MTQLELQLNKERDKLDAMMAHLRLDNRNGELVPARPAASFERRRSRSPRLVLQLGRYLISTLGDCMHGHRLVPHCRMGTLYKLDKDREKDELSCRKMSLCQFEQFS